MTKHAPASLIYVALGDSLTVGTGASYKGYVDRYVDYLRTDTRTQVCVINLGQDGQTSSELLHALRNDAYSQQTVSAASIITFNTGLNDLGHAGAAYERTEPAAELTTRIVCAQRWRLSKRTGTP